MAVQDRARYVALAGWGYALSGLGLVALSFVPRALAAVIEVALPASGPPGRAAALMLGIGGGLTAGMGVTLALVARGAAQGPRAVFRGLAAGLIAWWAVDSLASLGHGSWQNAVSNTGFLLLGLVPLVTLLRGDEERGAGAGAEATVVG